MTHIDLTTHFKQRRNISWQDKRDLTDTSNIMRYVFTHFTITTSRCLNKFSLLIAETHCQAVKFRLRDIFYSRIIIRQTQFSAHAQIKSLSPSSFIISFSVNAKHWHLMNNFGKTV